MSKTVEITIDGEAYETPDKKMTPNDLLALAELASAEYYLVQIKDKKQETYEGKGDETINLHKGAKFVSVFTGPTTVADGPITGAILFSAQLKEMGYDVKMLPDNHLMFPYTVEFGKFEGEQIMMGFVVPPDFPLTPPHGPHMDKTIHPIKGGGTHPSGGIHKSQSGHSKHFEDSWQHWSRPHPNWTGGNRNVARYMAFIRKLWATQ